MNFPKMQSILHLFHLQLTKPHSSNIIILYNFFLKVNPESHISPLFTVIVNIISNRYSSGTFLLYCSISLIPRPDLFRFMTSLLLFFIQFHRSDNSACRKLLFQFQCCFVIRSYVLFFPFIGKREMYKSICR